MANCGERANSLGMIEGIPGIPRGSKMYPKATFKKIQLLETSCFVLLAGLPISLHIAASAEDLFSSGFSGLKRARILSRIPHPPHFSWGVCGASFLGLSFPWRLGWPSISPPPSADRPAWA